MKYFNKNSSLGAAAALCLLVSATGLSFADENAKSIFGDSYQPVANVSDNQAQIVYYRAASASDSNGAAHVYIDREFQTALMPGGYTAFCVKPGVHQLGAYLKDEPLYHGKSDNVKSIELKKGTTYYFKVDEQGKEMLQEQLSSPPVAELLKTRKQIHLLSRASTVEPCHYLYKDYVLQSNVMFPFGKYKETDITQDGKVAIHDVAKQLLADDKKIAVIGYTDPIGSEESNRQLGMNRANTVRNLLIADGISASQLKISSQGSDNSLTQECSRLTRNKQIACYAPVRRVVVRIDN
ncbi:OmpA family protein [Dryocola clanedunensis]|uniref:OmpA family protein n=1 Tax=Cedecea sulfonylureivorans TaxID=3051154 RepID=UPI001928583D|nr:OmpA family protein [Cedecea sulfonylureivorans]